MKYIITDIGEVIVGEDTFHEFLHKGAEGTKVVSAGHCDFMDHDGSVKVYGRSVDYRIEAKFEDAEILSKAKESGTIIYKHGPRG